MRAAGLSCYEFLNAGVGGSVRGIQEAVPSRQSRIQVVENSRAPGRNSKTREACRVTVLRLRSWAGPHAISWGLGRFRGLNCGLLAKGFCLLQGRPSLQTSVLDCSLAVRV